MPDKDNYKNRAIALVVTVVVHALALVGLLFIYLQSVVPEEQGGILVNIGDTELASGMFMPHQLEPDFVPQEPQPTPEPVVEERLLTQETPEAPPMTTPPDNKKEQKERQKAEQQRLERQRAEEQLRQKELAEQRRREQIKKNVSGAFGGTGKSGTGSDPMAAPGRAGSPDGNVQSGGVNAGVGGFGSFSLGGRSLGSGGLQRPSYNVQEEGDIVINITVNPQGQVIQALIGAGTTIGNQTLRNSALSAAKATRFNAIDGLNNQTGTITYRFRLK